MKLIFAFTGISLLLNLLNNPKNSNSLKSKICKTWVAYEVVIAEPMMKRKDVIKINRANKFYDSLQINIDGSYYRYCRQTSYNGNFKLNADSTELFILPKSPTHANNGWFIIELSDSTFYLKQYAGREGESKTWKYKPVKEPRD